MAKAGKSVAVFERRPLLGGAAVTEEIIPGFKFSRASYLLGLLRPRVLRDLQLKVRLGVVQSLRSYWTIFTETWLEGAYTGPRLLLAMLGKWEELNLGHGPG